MLVPCFCLVCLVVHGVTFIVFCLDPVSTPSPRCPGQFDCADHKLCITLKWRCDAEPDCYDSSDEFHCSELVVLFTMFRSLTRLPFDLATCGDGYLCSDKKCIGTYQKCDGIMDCTGGDDEQGCGKSYFDVLQCTCV